MPSSSTHHNGPAFCRDYNTLLSTSTPKTCVRCLPCRRIRRDQRQRTIHKCYNCGRRMQPHERRYIRCKDCRKVKSPTSTSTCVDCHQDMPSYHKRKRLVQCHDCRQRRAFPQHQQPRYPMAYTSSSNTRTPLELGRMDIECKECKALHWKAEGTDVKGTDIKGDSGFEICCKKGSVKLDPLAEPPEQLRYFLSSNDSPVRRFRSRIRQYNAALTYTSCSYTTDPRLHPQEHSYIFQLQGHIYHHQGPLSTALGIRPSFTQLYFLDLIEAMQIRLNNNHQLSSAMDPSTLNTLDFLLRTQNPFHKLYRRTKEVLEQQHSLTSLRLTPQLRLITNNGTNPRRYNLPTVNHELAALIPDIPLEYGR